MDKNVNEEILDLEVIEEEDNLPTPSLLAQREVMSFEKLMEMGNVLAKSTIVPIQYQNRPENVFIALDLATRMGVSVMMVMQNLYIIQGRPSFSGQFIASLIRSNPQFTNVELHYVGTEGKEDWGAYVTATNVITGKQLKGTTVTIGMAKKEGWSTKAGSKWLTLPELMLGYRAFTFFGRLHCPELLSGLQSTDEIEDVTERQKLKGTNPYNK